jgi:hypothetical protein
VERYRTLAVLAAVVVGAVVGWLIGAATWRPSGLPWTTRPRWMR